MCFLSSYDCVASKQAQPGDADPKGLLKLGLIFGPVCKLFLGMAVPDTQTGKNQGSQVLSAAMFVSLFAKSFGAAVCLLGQSSSSRLGSQSPCEIDLNRQAASPTQLPDTGGSQEEHRGCNLDTATPCSHSVLVPHVSPADISGSSARTTNEQDVKSQLS